MTNRELAYRLAIAALLKVIERLCDNSCKTATKIDDYNKAQRLLDEPL